MVTKAPRRTPPRKRPPRKRPPSKKTLGKKAPGKLKANKSGLSGMMMAVVAMGGFGVVSPGAAGAIFLCMLPTLVLLFGNSDGLQMLRAQCVGYLNAAATFPFIVSIYNGDTTLVKELMEMKILLFPWGAALVGTFLQFVAPFLATSFLQLVADEKLNKIKTMKDKLVNEWGPEVTGVQNNRKDHF